MTALAQEDERLTKQMDVFPQRLQRLRERRQKSRRVVSELCGLPADAVRRYERAEARPNMEALVKLADYFEVSLDYLTGRANYR